jgi:crotonobetaine/carnitine-CoA ligase
MTVTGGPRFDKPSERTLGNVLRQQAFHRPETRFVVADDVSWTFADVDQRADGLARGLVDLGVAPGDTVAIYSGNRADLVPLVFAINRLGAVWVPINTDERGSWLRRTLQDSRATVVVVDSAVVGRVAEVMHGLPMAHLVLIGESDAPANLEELPEGVTLHVLDALASSSTRLPDVDVTNGDTSAVLWTSGTTGRPKGVMQSHNAWIRAALTGAASAQTRDDDVLYCCLPMCNSAAWIGVVFRSLVAGVPFGLDAGFSVSSFWERTRHFGATQAFTLGAMHLFLWQAAEQADDADNPVRAMGAIPMPDPVLEPFKARFGIELIQQGYGQSEVMGLISRVDGSGRHWNPGSVGLPLPGIDVRLFDDHDREVARGEVGEFCVRPLEPYVLFNGYFGDPEATLAALRNLWYHTGDLGRLDDDAQFHFVDRKRDLIRHKGRSVSSMAVEQAVRAHPDVTEVAAFGIGTAELASEAEIMVVVVVEAGVEIDPAQLARFVNDNAPHYLVPRYIDFVGELPHTPTGKIQKFDLRDRGVTATTWDRQRSAFVVER